MVGRENIQDISAENETANWLMLDKYEKLFRDNPVY